MRVKEIKYRNETSLMIYLTEDERNNPEVIEQINAYKKQYKSVSLFVSGKNDIKSVIKQMVVNNSK
jgi:hypothetical protein